MKLAYITAALTAALALGSISTAAAASDGTLTFNGNVVASSCSISAGGSGGANYTVTLPDVQVSSLASPGEFAGTSQPFDITLSGASCADGSSWSMNFEPTAQTVDSTTGALINQAAGGATDVQVQLLDNNLSPVNAATNANPQTVVIANNTGTLTYSARYLTPNGTATAGAVNATVEYSVVQN